MTASYLDHSSGEIIGGIYTESEGPITVIPKRVGNLKKLHGNEIFFKVMSHDQDSIIILQ